MGLTSSLFYNSNDSSEETLYKRIVPTDEQFEEQKQRWNDLADFLRPILKDETGYPVTSRLQGSYQTFTQIKPIGYMKEFDIDLGIIFSWEAKSDDGEYSPKRLREFVQESLFEYKTDGSEDILEIISPAKARCSRIRFEGQFHIDVPCYHLRPSLDKRNLATDVKWETSDPKAFNLWFKNEFDDYRRSKVRRVVQFVKCWAALRFKDDERPSSILLTVLIAEAFKGLPDAKVAADDDALAAVLRKMAERLDDNKEVFNPVENENTEDLASRISEEAFDHFITDLNSFSLIAQEALAADTKIDAADKWNEAFDHYFPMPQEIVLETKSNVMVPQVSLNIDVRAIPRNNPNKVYKGTNKLSSVPKDCDIYFEITNSEILPAGSQINWTVRNQGGEVEYVNNMRHRVSVNSNKANEYSAYVGTHHMDCIVRRFGSIIAFKRVPITIAGVVMPRRNPISRPSFVNLRKSS